MYERKRKVWEIYISFFFISIMNSKWFLAPLCAVVAVVVGLYKSDAFTYVGRTLSSWLDSKFVANLSALDKTYIVYPLGRGRCDACSL